MAEAKRGFIPFPPEEARKIRRTINNDNIGTKLHEYWKAQKPLLEAGRYLPEDNKVLASHAESLADGIDTALFIFLTLSESHQLVLPAVTETACMETYQSMSANCETEIAFDSKVRFMMAALKKQDEVYYNLISNMQIGRMRGEYHFLYGALFVYEAVKNEVEYQNYLINRNCELIDKGNGYRLSWVINALGGESDGTKSQDEKKAYSKDIMDGLMDYLDKSVNPETFNN